MRRGSEQIRWLTIELVIELVINFVFVHKAMARGNNLVSRPVIDVLAARPLVLRVYIYIRASILA